MRGVALRTTLSDTKHAALNARAGRARHRCPRGPDRHVGVTYRAAARNVAGRAADGSAHLLTPP